jgi:hypothetical protein
MVASLADKSALVNKASWPGIRLAEGDIRRPKAVWVREAMKGKAWQQPLCQEPSGQLRWGRWKQP